MIASLFLAAVPAIQESNTPFVQVAESRPRDVVAATKPAKTFQCTMLDEGKRQFSLNWKISGQRGYWFDYNGVRFYASTPARYEITSDSSGFISAFRYQGYVRTLWDGMNPPVFKLVKDGNKFAMFYFDENRSDRLDVIPMSIVSNDPIDKIQTFAGICKVSRIPQQPMPNSYHGDNP